MDSRTPLLTAALLALTLPAASAGPAEDAAALSARCDFTTGVTVNTSEPLLVLAGLAAAPGAVQTEVACQLLDSTGAPVLAGAWARPGSAAAGEAHTDFRMQMLTVCTSAHAVYADGSEATLPRTCVTP